MSDILKCPTCQDSDCIESVRHDNCTACGWAQVTPLENPSRFQPEKKEIEMSPMPCGCRWVKVLDCSNPAHQPSPSPSKVEKAILETTDDLWNNLGRLTHNEIDDKLQTLVRIAQEK